MAGLVLDVDPYPYSFEVSSADGVGGAPYTVKLVYRSFYQGVKIDVTTFYELPTAEIPLTFFNLTVKPGVLAAYTDSGYEYPPV